MSRTVSDRSHLSIGEVLNLLQDEFPDVTISKIRFLESQGLLDPERTPSGYRKFYNADIDRLRWILRQQRENFLPLKVIKDRLDEVPFDELLATEEAERLAAIDQDGQPTQPEDEHGVLGAEGDPGPEPESLDSSDPAGGDGAGLFAQGAVAASMPGQANPDAPAPPPPPPPPPGARDGPLSPAPFSQPELGESWPPPSEGGAAESPRVEAPAGPAAERLHKPATRTGQGSLLDTGETTVNMTAEELARVTGLTPRQVGDLERFGLIAGEALGNAVYFGEDAVLSARTAAAFMKHGIEARHLRMYKVAAEREAGVLEQVIMPVLKQRGPDARQHALELLEELVALGDNLRHDMLRRSLRNYLERS